MKKNLFLASAVVLSLGVAVTIGTTASAAPEGSTVTTKLKAPITTPPTGPIVTPTDPGGNTGQNGPLSLDYVSPLDFGENEISSKTQTFTAQGTNKLGLQVTDTRGTGVGWKVDVKISEFAGKKPTNTLKGAVLTLPIGTLVTGNEAGNGVAAPTPTSVKLDLKDTSKTIFAAAVDKGLGTWFSEFAKVDTTLEVPAGNYADEYSASLTWTLSDTI